jgi:hypothetical protein
MHIGLFIKQFSATMKNRINEELIIPLERSSARATDAVKKSNDGVEHS